MVDVVVKQGKCTLELKVHLGDTLAIDLKKDAAKSGHESLSSYVRFVLRKHLYGNLNPYQDEMTGTVRDC